MKIAYLTSMYPDVSHTFIVREVAALRSSGVHVETFSVRRPGPGNILGAEARDEAARTRWLVPPSVGAMARACGWLAGRRLPTALMTLGRLTWRGGLRPAAQFKWICYLAEAALLAHWLARERFDHLHCHFGNSGASTGMLAAKLAGVSFSMTCHGSELRAIEAHRLPEKVAAARFVACVSHHGRTQLMLACAPELWSRLHIVRCGVPPAEPAAPRLEGPLRLLCVGRLSFEKGHTVLLSALAELRGRGVDFSCTLVGDGPLRGALQRQAAALGLLDRLVFTGSAEPARVAEHYAACDVVVLASLSEGVPVVLMEAMARGLPVVATRVGGVPELVEHGRTGLVVDPGDSAALAAALAQIAQNRDWALGLGREAVVKVRNHFNISRSAAALARLFAEAVDSAAPSMVARPAALAGRPGAEVGVMETR